MMTLYRAFYAGSSYHSLKHAVVIPVEGAVSQGKVVRVPRNLPEDARGGI